MVEVKVAVKDGSSSLPLSAAIYSRSNCLTYALSCIATGMHSALASPSKLSCPQGAQIFARTSTPGYYLESTSAPCFQADQPIVLLIARYEDTSWIRRAASDADRAGKSSDAAILFNEAYQLDPSKTDSADQALLATAKALQLNADQALVFDSQQKRKVASPELVNAIKKFQVQQGLQPDGILGSQTLQKLSGNRSSPTVLHEYAVQPSSFNPG
jgi:hypothetical protein